MAKLQASPLQHVFPKEHVHMYYDVQKEIDKSCERKSDAPLPRMKHYQKMFAQPSNVLDLREAWTLCVWPVATQRHWGLTGRCILTD